RLKPPRLIVGRIEGKIERRARLIPYAVIVGRRDMEVVLAGRQVAVEDLAARARVPPLVIAPVEPIPEPDFLRDGEAQCRIADFDVATARGKANELVNRVDLPIGTHFLDADRWNNTIFPQSGRINHLQDRIVYEPEASVSGFGHGRLK